MPFGMRFASFWVEDQGETLSRWEVFRRRGPGGICLGDCWVDIYICKGWRLLFAHFQGYHCGENSICTRIIEDSSLQRIKSYSKERLRLVSSTLQRFL
jgi:hypothetical protein